MKREAKHSGTMQQATTTSPFVSDPVPRDRFTWVDQQSLNTTAFLATRDELSAIAHYWLTLMLDLEYDWDHETGSAEIRLVAIANRRLGAIEQILGRDAIDDLNRKVMGERNSAR
jgi:hypothetical protein